MKEQQEKFIRNIKLGGKQIHNGMCVFPVFAVTDSTVRYISMKQALNSHVLEIREVNQGGSVPQLLAANLGDIPILLLDGEEVSGAKQNRILNSSILLKEKSETVIPVSCTERGRWSYSKPQFEESGNVVSAKIRSMKAKDVSYNLERDGSFRSDQSKVWHEIDKMASFMQVESPTDAMQDVFQASLEKLEDYIKAFPLQEKQVGIIVCLGDKVTGLDCLSSSEVWADLHAKLIKSYAMDCLGRSLEESQCTEDKVQEFLDKFSQCSAKAYPSVGYGEDFRFESPELIGSALAWQDTFIHTELYSRQEQEYETGYHSPRNRFRYIQ